MKKLYFTLTLCLLSIFANAQTFEYSLTYMGINTGTNNHQIALIAVPNTDISDGNTADMGAIFYIPTGLTIGNYATADSNIPASQWTSTSFGPAGGGQDLIQIFRTPGAANVFFNQTSGTPIQLAVFDIIAVTNPTSGAITLLENTDPNAWVPNYLNIDLGSGTTTDEYMANNPGANSIDFSTLSTNNISFEEAKISIYPNPTRGNLTIETNKAISYSIYNILGQSVKLKGELENNSNKSISLSHLPDGIYILKAEDDNNNSKSFKIIKKE